MHTYNENSILLLIPLLIILIPLLIFGYKKFNKYYASNNSSPETSNLSVNKSSFETSNLSVKYNILKIYQLILGVMIILSIISLIYFLNTSTQIPFGGVLLCVFCTLISIFCIVSNILIVIFLFELDKR